MVAQDILPNRCIKMTSQKTIMIVAVTLAGASLLGAFGTVRSANAGGLEPDRCDGEVLLCRTEQACPYGVCGPITYFYMKAVE